MEHSRAERVAESSIGRVAETRPRHTRPKSIRKPRAQPTASPTSSSVQTKKRRPRKEVERHGYYDLKFPFISDEKRGDKGVVHYFVHWADHPETKEVYQPNWEPHFNIVDKWIEHWERRKIQQKEAVKSSRQTSSPVTTQDSPPTRPAKRRRLLQDHDSVSQEQSSVQKPRRAGSVSSARFQVVSEDSPEVLEIPDSYEKETQPLSKPCVEITVRDDFDPITYATVIISSSQPTQVSQPSQTLYSSSASQQTAYAPLQLLPSTPEPIDEDREAIVPDSQDPHDSSSYQPEDTPTSISGRTTRQNTDVNTEPDSEAIAFRSTHCISSSTSDNIDSQLAEPLSNHTSSSYQPPNPTQAVTSEDSTSTRQQTETSWGELSASQLVAESSSVPVRLLSQSLSEASPPNTIRSVSSHSQLSSSHLISPPRERGAWPEEGLRILTELQISQSSVPEAQLSPNSPFQTQHSCWGGEEEGRGQALNDFASESALHLNEPDLNQQSQLLEEVESQTTEEESSHPPHQSITPNLRSISRSESTWNAAKTISATSPLAQVAESPQSVTGFHKAQENPPAFVTKGSALSTPNSALTQIDLNTTRPAATQPSYHSLPSPESSEHFSPEPSQHILVSIEQHVDDYSSFRTSRPSPPLGSLQLPETYGSNSPTRPSTATPSSMDDRTAEENQASMKEQALQLIKKIRADKISKKAASEEASRASSSIPPSPLPSVINQPIPLRDVPVELPLAEQEASVQPSTELEEFRTSLQIVPNEQDQFFVPLPINAIARDIYTQVIKTNKYNRFSFLDDEIFDPGLISEIDGMISELDLLCSHQDLISDDFSTQRNVSDDIQAKWAENQSTKCMFVAELLGAMRHFDKHIAILVRPGRMLEILEILLRHHGFIHRQQDRPEYSCDLAIGALKVSLIPTGHSEQAFAVTPTSLVIAFDSTFSTEPYLKDLRANLLDPQSPSPLIFLLVSHSVEHIQLCFDKNIEGIERKIRLVNCLSQIAGEVGKLTPDYLNPYEAAKEISNFVVVNGSDPEMWPCLPMPEIEELDLNIDSATQPQPTEVQQSDSTTQPYAIALPALNPQPGVKRQLGDEDAMELGSPKRQRFTPVPGEQTNNADIMYASDPILHSSTVNMESRVAEDDDRTAICEEARKSQVSALMQRVSDLESQLRDKQATESQLRRSNLSLESRIRDVESSISDIQPKYQEALNDRGHFEYEVKEALIRTNTLKQKLDARVEEITKLKEQKRAADAALIDARTALASSTVPEIAEMEKLQEEVRTLKTDKERLQKRITNMSNDLDYMRNNYQTASSSAASSASELLSAQAEIESLQAKASVNRVRIHEIQNSNEVATYLGKLRQLKAENEELEKELEKRNTELAAVMNGRRATRGTSVPRSPRMGQGTMSPGPARTIGRVMQMGGVGGGNRSRGNSPASGELAAGIGRAYTNLFGDPLYPQTQAGSRFGNHLQ